MKIFDSILITICLVFGVQSNAQTFRYFNVQTLSNLVILTPKNHVLLPARPRNEYNMYAIKNQTDLKQELKKCLQVAFPPSDTSFMRLLDSIEYKSIFRKDLKIYYCEYYVSPQALPRVQKIEDKLFQFFKETQTINLNDYLRMDSARFEQSNLSISKLGWLLK